MQTPTEYCVGAVLPGVGITAVTCDTMWVLGTDHMASGTTRALLTEEPPLQPLYF